MVKRILKKSYTFSAAEDEWDKKQRRDVAKRAASADQAKPTQHLPNGAELVDTITATCECETKKAPTPFVIWTTMPLQLTSIWWDACERAARKAAELKLPINRTHPITHPQSSRPTCASSQPSTCRSAIGAEVEVHCVARSEHQNAGRLHVGTPADCVGADRRCRTREWRRLRSPHPF